MSDDLNGLAVDFGGTKIAAARITNNMIIKRLQRRTSGDASIEFQINMIQKMLQELDLDDLDPVGIAVSGRVSDGGVWHAVNESTLSNIREVPLGGILEKRLHRSIFVQNDAIAATVAEARIGAGFGINRFAYLTISTGVGGGIIINGQTVNSKSGLAGHLGFTTSRVGQAVCGSGRKATVESIASGNALARLAAEGGYGTLDAKAIFERAEKGEPWANRLIDQSALVIAELGANLKAIFDIERIAIGGSIGLASGYLDRVNAALMCEPELFRPHLAPAKLAGDEALFGALMGSS